MSMQSCVANERLSTGPLKPEGDWPGLFIRGDEAMFLAQMLHHINKTAKSDCLTELEKLLLSSFGPKS